MTISQAILSLSPTSCHVFIAIIEQNLCHNRLISWMILPWAGKRPGPCVSVWTRCYNNLLTGGCWERSRNRTCFERALPLNHWKKQEMRDNFCVVWCGQSEGHPFAVGQRGDAATSSWQNGGWLARPDASAWGAGVQCLLQRHGAARAGAQWRQMETSCKVICSCQRWIIHGWLDRGHQSILVEFPPAELHFNQGWDPEGVFNTLECRNPFSLFCCLDSAAGDWGNTKALSPAAGACQS